MKKLMLLLIIPSLAMANTDYECFAQEEANKVIRDFADQAATSDYLYHMASDKLKESVDFFFKDVSKERQLLISNSTEVIFESGAIGNHADARKTVIFPAQGCVWNIMFGLPSKIRKQCDDGGMYGYSFLFEKINDRVFFHEIFADGVQDEPICKALLKITNKKIDEK